MADKQSEKPPLDKQPPEVLSPAAVLGASRASRTARHAEGRHDARVPRARRRRRQGRAYWIRRLPWPSRTRRSGPRRGFTASRARSNTPGPRAGVGGGDVVYWHATGGCLSVIDPGGHMRVGAWRTGMRPTRPPPASSAWTPCRPGPAVAPARR